MSRFSRNSKHDVFSAAVAGYPPFTQRAYNGAKLFNMLPIQMKKIKNPNTFKTMTKDWIWENIPSD